MASPGIINRTSAVEVSIQHVVALLGREFVMRDDRGEVKEGIVVAGVLPIEKAHVGSIDNIGDNKIVVATT